MLSEEGLYELLDKRGISYEVHHHKAVFTVAEADEIPMPVAGVRTKNLFLWNKKGRFWLVVAPEDKRVDLKALRHVFGTSRLSFANEDLLAEHTGLISGSVTPLGALNDDKGVVEVVLDSDLAGKTMDLHPLVNTATMFMQTADVEALLCDHGTTVTYVDVSQAD